MFKLAENLKKEMENRKLTIRELSEMTGLSHGIICEISTGKATNPKIKTLINISNALKIPLMKLLGLERGEVNE